MTKEENVIIDNLLEIIRQQNTVIIQAEKAITHLIGKLMEKEFKALPDEKMTFMKWQWAELGCIVSNLIETDGEKCSSSCQFLDGEMIAGCYIWENEEIEEHTCVWKRHPDCIRLVGENNDLHKKEKSDEEIVESYNARHDMAN